MGILSLRVPWGRVRPISVLILDFREFDSSVILILRGGILMSIGSFPESLSQQILVGIIHIRREIGRTTRHAPSSYAWAAGTLSSCILNNFRLRHMIDLRRAWGQGFGGGYKWNRGFPLQMILFEMYIIHRYNVFILLYVIVIIITMYMILLWYYIYCIVWLLLLLSLSLYVYLLLYLLGLLYLLL